MVFENEIQLPLVKQQIILQFSRFDVSPTVVFTTHVPMFFWPNRHTFSDIELKLCILS